MTSSRRTFSTILKVAIFVGLLACWLIYVWYKRHELDNNFKITTGTINGVTKSGWKGSGRGIEYEYYVDGKKYNGEGGSKNLRYL